MLERGIAWLSSYQAKQVDLLENGISEVKPYKKFADDIDALVFMIATDAGLRNDAMLRFLDRDRTRISIYAKAMFGLALEKLGEKEKLALVLQNIGQYVVQDDENQTAYLKLPNEGYWWSWYGSEIETHAFYLKLLAKTDPKGALAPRLVKYLLNNRKHGTYWNSTRDTAFCVEALADFLRASGEDRPEMTVTLALDGQTRKEVKITPESLFGFDNALVLEGEAIETGPRTISIVKQGKGPLYFNAYLTNFTLEDPITRAGLEVKVNRKVYKLIPEDKKIDVAGGRGQTVGQKVEKHRREHLSEGATLKSGDLVEVELEIDSKNDYEYLVFEDYKAAGFEPVEVRSGYNGNDLAPTSSFAMSVWRSSAALLLAASTVSRTACAPRSPASSTPSPLEPGPCTHRSCGGIRTRSSSGWRTEHVTSPARSVMPRSRIQNTDPGTDPFQGRLDQEGGPSHPRTTRKNECDDLPSPTPQRRETEPSMMTPSRIGLPTARCRSLGPALGSRRCSACWAS